MRLPLWLLSLVLFGVSMLSMADELEAVSLQLKWRHQFQFAGYYAAVEKGFYADAGFDVTLIEHRGGSDLFEPVISGEAQFGLADSSIVVKRLQGAPVVVVSTVFQHSPLVMISLKGRGILSPYEFAGRRIMFQRGEDDASIQAMLTSLGLQPDDYELVPHNFDNFALLDDTLNVDVMSAYLSNQPYLYLERGYEVQVVDPANYGIDFYGDLLYTNEAYLRASPDRVQAFREASLRGWNYALENPEEVIGWLQSTYPSSKSDDALHYEAEVISQMVAKNFVALGTLYPERFERIAEIYKRLKLAPENVELEGLVLEGYLNNESRNQAFVRWALLVTLILAAGVLILMMINRKLQQTIQRRTEQLDQLNQQLGRQVELTDRYVIFAEVDRFHRFTKVSDAFCQASGYRREQFLAMKTEDLVSAEQLDGHFRVVEDVLLGVPWQGEMTYRKADGGMFWVQMYVDPLKDDEGHVIGYTATANDITYQKEVERLSQTDPLTGLANRMKLDLELGREWARFYRYQQHFSIIIVDLDHFKTINDQYGHQEGDLVLKKAADVLSSLLRTTDIIGRWGGEEFLILLPQTDADTAYLVAEKLRAGLPLIEGLRSPAPTGSFGTASTSVFTSSAEDLIRAADRALYQAKASGRNRVMVAES
ncbi:ABC transporter substrate-binding protein [Reinekea blandensis]|uniref:diguanylate cyclase n=1 Tax=Reinekea blandensis MED297 TaxID=314283 RepID=A4B9R1_9GAMM|nr:ABC transporter substrate-binding protein [Reinekea blandensis]EAR11362.1 predicted signal transduction protein containing a membrane domain, an EAL and a GGDEF domain [Reinekea sp. MED297] [Reinekea blandensis MED297]